MIARPVSSAASADTATFSTFARARAAQQQVAQRGTDVAVADGRVACVTDTVGQAGQRAVQLGRIPGPPD